MKIRHKSIILLVIGPLLIELICFICFQRQYGSRGYDIGKLSRGRYQDSPYTLFEPIQNTINLKAEWRQNNYGFRNEDDVNKKHDSEYRIFILGGSAALGQGGMGDFGKISRLDEYPTKYTLSHQIRENLAKHYPNKMITVFNAAVSGYTLSEEFALYLSRIRYLEPDLIVWMGGYNDMFFPLLNEKYNPYEKSRRAWSEHRYRRSKIYKYGMMLMSKSHALFYFGQYYLISQSTYDEKFYRKYLDMNVEINDYELRDYFANNKENIEKVLDDLFRRYHIFKETCQIDGVDIIFSPQPILTLKNKMTDTEKACFNYLMEWKKSLGERLPYFTLYQYYLARFDQFAKKKNWLYLNLQNEISNLSSGVFIDYCHYSFEGNKIIADLIFQKIVQTNLLNG